MIYTQRGQVEILLPATISALLLVAMALSVPAAAQAISALPQAPAPRVQPPAAQSLSPEANREPASDRGPVHTSPQRAQSQPQPALTMFPHPEGARYFIAGQANIISQANPRFHSPYAGPNSFRSVADDETSLVGTLYLAARPTRSVRYSNDLILDVESTGGHGLSEALGLAGFTNLDVVRNPSLGAAPYLSRYEVHQVIGLTSRTEPQDPGPFALAASVPVRRIEFRAGKMSLPDFFDINAVGSDSHLQFMNWTVDNGGAWDYAADTRGYTVGGLVEYDDHAWTLRYGIFAMPTEANGESLDWAFSRAHGQNWELDWRHSFIAGQNGATRLLFYANRAHMGTYRTAVIDFLNGTDALLYGVDRPTITLHRQFGALKYGFEYNAEQQVTANLRLGARVGWDDGRTESFAYTEDDQTVEICGDYAAARWHRPNDKLGVALVSDAIKKDHQNYLRHGGLGFLLGDGALTYGRENIVESYYNLHAWRGLYYAADMQHIANPGYNRARGPVWVGSLRMHVDF